MTATRTIRAQGRRSRLCRAALFVLAVAGAAGLTLVASACGGSAGPGVAQVGSTTTHGSGSSSADPAAYSACMRRHGVPNFPDPDSQGRLLFNSGSGINPRSPQFRAAQRACQRLLPNGGKPDAHAQAEFLKQALKFSRCMRSHGLPNFPDPQTSGNGIGLTIGKNSGIDPNSPQFKSAQHACQSLLPGQKGHGGGPLTTTGKPQSGGVQGGKP